MKTVKGAATLLDLNVSPAGGGQTPRDYLGRITQIVAPAGSKQNWTYAYSSFGELTAAANAEDSTLSQTWAYDSAGNMTANSKLCGGAPNIVYPDANGAAAGQGISSTPVWARPMPRCRSAALSLPAWRPWPPPLTTPTATPSRCRAMRRRERSAPVCANTAMMARIIPSGSPMP